MPSKKLPSYRLHKQSGQAIVTLSDGCGRRRDILLGEYGTPSSRMEYARALAEWETSGTRLAKGIRTNLSVNELMIRYWHFAEGYYRKNGEPTKQLDRVKRALVPVKTLYGHTTANDFGPLALKAVREWMIKQEWTRGFINSCTGCIKRMFKWAVENELVPPSHYHGLQAVAGFRRGRSGARESQRIRPVPPEHVHAVLPRLTQSVQAMVQVQWHAGMRPGEVILMRPCDIDKASPKVWVYRPESHKTEHHGIDRVIFLGPQAQAILDPFLNRESVDYLFSPYEAMRAFRALQRERRKTRVQPSQWCRKKAGPKKAPGCRYTVDSYRRAIEMACERAGVLHWHPNQLRHTKATEIRREAGLDAARVVIGHRSPQITETYAEIDVAKAAEVMARLG